MAIPLSCASSIFSCLQELDAYGSDTFGPSDLPKLPYLEACLKEAMRLYPPGVFLIREPLTEDFHLMDITIPKGTWIHVRLILICILTSGHCCLIYAVRSDGIRILRSPPPALCKVVLPTLALLCLQERSCSEALSKVPCAQCAPPACSGIHAS